MAELLDAVDFNARVVPAYQFGTADAELEADEGVARSIIPPRTRAVPGGMIERATPSSASSSASAVPNW